MCAVCYITGVRRVTGFGGSGSQVDSARMNLASSFVNGFVNAAFGQDKLLTDDGNKWLYKNKDHGTKSKLRFDMNLVSAGQPGNDNSWIVFLFFQAC